MTDDDAKLRDHFLAWQCRVRQHAMRRLEGRPTPGMQPRVLDPGGTEIHPAMTLLIVEADPAETTAQFRHIVRKTHDPATRLQDAVKLLSSSHYQRAARFSDVMTALFPDPSPTAARLCAAAGCVLEFEQFSQSYRMAGAIAALTAEDAAYQATYWHNAMFNPAMPGAVRILAFTPDWRRTTAYPPV